MISTIQLFEDVINENRFIIHEHQADKAGLHYDIRLEKDNVLKSWATRKLPELINTDLSRIQLFPTPDHDIEWLTFGLKIPYIINDGYGKGKVVVFDKGIYKQVKWTNEKITIYFNGKKIKGLYTIIPYKDTSLMIKHKNK